MIRFVSSLYHEILLDFRVYKFRSHLWPQRKMPHRGLYCSNSCKESILLLGTLNCSWGPLGFLSFVRRLSYKKYWMLQYKKTHLKKSVQKNVQNSVQKSRQPIQLVCCCYFSFKSLLSSFVDISPLNFSCICFRISFLVLCMFAFFV